NNITAPNGYFSLKYLFPDYGIYQVIATVGSNISAVALASFQINYSTSILECIFFVIVCRYCDLRCRYNSIGRNYIRTRKS
ncbi:MAG TPA: hypothetical protein VH481_09640, partial [Nitrososphaeraceae archaeon]